jgi:superfamily I DNA and/or RNA helicase
MHARNYSVLEQSLLRRRSSRSSQAIRRGQTTPVLQTRYIQGGYSDADSTKPINKPEADAIIEQIKQCCADPAYAGKTIGVISLLNTSGQAEYIERRFKTDNILSKEEMDERKLRIGDAYVFQGDERDIMFLSMVTAPAPDGKRVSVMAAPKDERRFNVAASRARDSSLAIPLSFARRPEPQMQPI